MKMRKKILIGCSGCLVVVLALVIGVAIWLFPLIKGLEKGKNEEEYFKVVSSLLHIYTRFSGLPTYISNKLLPPINLKNKSKEKQKEIVVKLIKEIEYAGGNYMMGRYMEAGIKLLRIGTPLVPVLLDIIQDKNTEDIYTVRLGGWKCTRSIRKGCITLLGQIIKAKRTPLEKYLEGVTEEPYRSALKRMHKYANRIEIDIDKVVSKLRGMLEEALPNNDDEGAIVTIVDFLCEVEDKEGIDLLIKAFNIKYDEMMKRYIGGYSRGWETESNTKKNIQNHLMILLKETKDRRIAEALDKGGNTYGVWIYVDEAGRKKAINIAMDILKGNYLPKLTIEEKEWVEYAELPREYLIKKYAIKVLGDANAKEAVPLLIEVLEKEKDSLIREDIIFALGEIKDKRAVEPLINRLRKRLNPPPPEGYSDTGTPVIEALVKIGDKRAVEILEKLLESEDEVDLIKDDAAKALKKLTGKEYKYKEGI